MNNKININNDYVLRKSKIIGQTNINQNKSTIAETGIKNTKSFQEILDKVKSSDNIKFSKHASSRLESRNINLTASEIEKLNDAVSKAGSKGVKEALIMMDNKVYS